MSAGIYIIRNILNGKVYVGSSANVRKRWESHKSYLRRNASPSVSLQQAWDKYGESAFEFVVVEPVLLVEDLLAREQRWIDRLQTTSKSHGYNIALFAGSPTRGRRTSEDIRAKLSAALRGIPKSSETRAKIAAGRKGIVPRPAGFHHSEETLQRMRDAARARHPRPPISEETRAKLSRRICSPETRMKMSQAHAGQTRSPKARANLAAAAQRTEVRAKKSESMKRFWALRKAIDEEQKWIH